MSAKLYVWVDGDQGSRFGPVIQYQVFHKRDNFETNYILCSPDFTRHQCIISFSLSVNDALRFGTRQKCYFRVPHR